MLRCGSVPDARCITRRWTAVCFSLQRPDAAPPLSCPATAVLQSYANGRGIKLIGDMPIYVGGHSADVWANRHLFELNDEGLPADVSGVPPDAFSATGTASRGGASGSEAGAGVRGRAEPSRAGAGVGVRGRAHRGWGRAECPGRG